MKTLKYILVAVVVFVVLAMSSHAVAQTGSKVVLTPDKVPVTGITGTLNIDFGTRQLANMDANGKPKHEAVDVYDLDVFIGNELQMKGTITYKQAQKGSIIQGKAATPRILLYQINFTAYRSSDWRSAPAGSLSGQVPISDANEYRYSDGDLNITSRMLKGGASEFRGIAVGKPPESGRLSRIGQMAKLKVAKLVNGQAKAVVVTDYDMMGYPGGVTFAAGPVDVYPAVLTKGTAMYDRVRYAWFFTVKDRDLLMQYNLRGKDVEDRIGGTVLWVEDPQRMSNGKGEYIFDVRLNDKVLSSDEAQLFEKESDESAFFEPQATANALSGKWTYVDQFEGETVVSSKVQIALVGGADWDKTRLMNFTKMFLLSAIIPVNSE